MATGCFSEVPIRRGGNYLCSCLDDSMYYAALPYGIGDRLEVAVKRLIKVVRFCILCELLTIALDMFWLVCKCFKLQHEHAM